MSRILPTQTYQKYRDSFATRGRARINPYPQNLKETILALQALCQYLLDPIVDHLGKEGFQLTYGFCSKNLKRFLSQKDLETEIKKGALI